MEALMYTHINKHAHDTHIKTDGYTPKHKEMKNTQWEFLSIFDIQI